MEHGHEVDKQVSYKFVVDKLTRKHHLQLVLKQLLLATQNCSRKGINSKNNTCLRNTRKYHGKI